MMKLVDLYEEVSITNEDKLKQHKHFTKAVWNTC